MKIFCNYPEVVKAALKENNADLEFMDSAADADIKLPEQKFPIRIGVLLDMFMSQEIYELNGFQINFSHSKIRYAGNEINLTEKEKEILQYLIKNAAGVSKEEMLKNIWRYAENSNTATVETHIYRLKTKLAEICDKDIIENTGGVYRILK